MPPLTRNEKMVRWTTNLNGNCNLVTYFPWALGEISTPPSPREPRSRKVWLEWLDEESTDGSFLLLPDDMTASPWDLLGLGLFLAASCDTRVPTKIIDLSWPRSSRLPPTNFTSIYSNQFLSPDPKVTNSYPKPGHGQGSSSCTVLRG